MVERRLKFWCARGQEVHVKSCAIHQGLPEPEAHMVPTMAQIEQMPVGQKLDRADTKRRRVD